MRKFDLYKLLVLREMIKENIKVGHTYKRTEVMTDYDCYCMGKFTTPIRREVYIFRTVFEVLENVICIGHLDGFNLEWVTKEEFVREYNEV